MISTKKNYLSGKWTIICGGDMQEIINLWNEFDDYTKRLVGQLYYEGSLKDGKRIEKICKKRIDNNSVRVMRKQNNIQ